MCERTVSRLIEAGLLSVGVLDQQRKCKLKLRRSKTAEMKIDPKCRIGRKMEDFERFIKETPVSSVVQMDTVYGSASGKVLFTMIFVKTDLMLAFLCDNRTSACILDKIRFLWEGLGEETFAHLFPVLLTDNGSEFSNPSAIELRENGSVRTRVFYCDPGASYQKGAVERNHEFIRLFLPQGSSFDVLTQAQVNRMMSHINSYSRSYDHSICPFNILYELISHRLKIFIYINKSFRKK